MTAETIAESPLGLSFEIDVRDQRWCDDVADLESACQAAINASWAPIANEGPHEVSIVLGDDRLQQTLNRDYRGKDASTNVLSFPSGEFGAPSLAAGVAVQMGDIVLAYETVRRESEDMNKPLGDHLCHLLVHGMLHLAGHDHETDEDAAVMEALEVEVLASLGIANPYAVFDDVREP